jgi:hypothetical protein
MTPSFMGGDSMSTRAAEQHEKAAAQYGHAARHYKEAAEYHKAGQYGKAAHHAHTARWHHEQAMDHASEAAKAHAEHYGKQEDFWAEAQVLERL